jgi:hypothetical protein
MDLSRLNFRRLAVGAGSAFLLIISLLFLPWYTVEPNQQRLATDDEELWLCGIGETECTGWETFPILRWLLILAALAPIILAWILVRGHKLSYPPGEMTMIAGFAATVLIAYNGIVDRPGSGPGETGIGLDYGYWIALVCAVAIAVVGWTRSIESGGRRARKAPGTV